MSRKTLSPQAFYAENIFNLVFLYSCRLEPGLTDLQKNIYDDEIAATHRLLAVQDIRRGFYAAKFMNMLGMKVSASMENEIEERALHTRLVRTTHQLSFEERLKYYYMFYFKLEKMLNGKIPDIIITERNRVGEITWQHQRAQQRGAPQVT